MNPVTLIGYENITAKDGRLFTKAYVVYDGEKVEGQACRDVFLTGHELKPEMVNTEVNLIFDIGSGKVIGIEAA